MSCSYCKTFRSKVEEIQLRALYTNRVRQTVLDRLFGDKLNVEGLRCALGRDFYLEFATGASEPRKTCRVQQEESLIMDKTN